MKGSLLGSPPSAVKRNDTSIKEILGVFMYYVIYILVLYWFVRVDVAARVET